MCVCGWVGVYVCDAVADDEVGLSLELKLDLNAANPVLEIL